MLSSGSVWGRFRPLGVYSCYIAGLIGVSPGSGASEAFVWRPSSYLSSVVQLGIAIYCYVCSGSYLELSLSSIEMFMWMSSSLFVRVVWLWRSPKLHQLMVFLSQVDREFPEVEPQVRRPGWLLVAGLLGAHFAFTFVALGREFSALDYLGVFVNFNSTELPIVLYVFMVDELRYRLERAQVLLKRWNAGVARLHCLLREAGTAIGSVWGLPFLITTSTSIFYLLVYLLKLITCNQQQTYIVENIIFTYSNLIIIILTTGRMLAQYRQVIKITSHYTVSHLGEDEEFQLEYFLGQVEAHPVRIRFVGLGDIDLSFIGWFSTLMITYFIAETQFKDEIFAILDTCSQ